MNRTLRFHAIGVIGSITLHLAGRAGLSALPARSESARPATTLSFDVKSRPPPPSEDRPAPPPLPAVPRSPPPEPKPQAATPEPPPELEPEPDPAQPVDLTGVTLTSDGSGSGWSSWVGNGQSSPGPIRNPRTSAARTAKSGEAPRPGTTNGSSRPAAPRTPALVSVADLSRRPLPPALDGTLRANYPAEARRQGLSGTAVVLIRIDPDGRVRSSSLRSESAPGFGRACRDTVLGSVWTPPVDRQGRAVATEVSYTCRFLVER